MQTYALNAKVDWLDWLQSLVSQFWGQSSAVISILILATLLYKGYKVLEGSLVLRGVLSITLLYFVSYILRLEFLIWLLDRIIPTLLILMAIILQPELRRIFMQIGRQIHVTHRQYLDQQVIKYSLEACEQLADMGRGALIVFRRENLLRHIVRTGTMLNSVVSAELLISIFAYDTPLHDGATVLADSKIIAGGCILPIDPEDLEDTAGMGIGMRHRSALELARETDAVILVVSEESSCISLAYDGQMRSQMSQQELVERLYSLLIGEEDAVPQNRFLAWLQKLGRLLKGENRFGSIEQKNAASEGNSEVQKERRKLEEAP